MKKRNKQLAAILLCLSMGAGLLGGCGQQGDSGTESSGKVSEQPSESSSERVPEENPADDASEGGGVDRSEKVVIKMKVNSNASQGDWNEYYFIKYLEEEFNVDFQIEMISDEIWAEKLPLMFATNELPDLFVSGLTADNVTTYGGQGYLLPLEEYITEETMPTVWDMFERYPDTRKASTELDGHVYSINGMSAVTRERTKARFFIRTEWANEILGKVPRTVDEYYEYLKGVKERDMDGDGDSGNEIPLGGFYSAPDYINPMLSLVTAFGFTSLDVEIMDGGKAVYVPAQDNYKEFLKYMNKLFAEGLLDKEFFTQTADQFNAKDAQSLYGSMAAWNTANGRPEEEQLQQYEGFEPMTSSVSSTKMWPGNNVSFSSILAVTKNCENVDRVLEIVDWMYSHEAQIMVNYGWEMDTNPDYPGYGYKAEWLKDDHSEISVSFYGPAGADDVPEGYDSYSNFRYNIIGPGYGSMPVYRPYNEVYLSPLQKWLTHCTEDFHAAFYREPFPIKAKFSEEDNSELNLLLTDVKAYKSEMETKMITGELDIEETWPDYIQGLKDRGMDKMVEIWQRAYDNWMKN